jgi:signal transduction histidine kinase
MAERVAEAGGRFDVATAPGMGTALTMSFPLQ